MRAGVIQRVVSRLLWVAVAALAVPLAVSLAGREPLRVWLGFAIAGATAALLAAGTARLPRARTAPRDSLKRREGFLSVVLAWVIVVFFTAVAYHVSGEFPGFAECFFESMSGFTTTGATILHDIEAMPTSILVMRSLSHWIGGMGIIILMVAILPELSVGGLQLVSTEVTGIDSEKLAPRIAATARRLWFLYVAITAILLLLLWPATGFFDAVNHAMSTIATGGFSTRNASVGGLDSLYAEVVILLFMYLSGISFALQYRVFVRGKPLALVRSPEVRLYTAIMAIAVAAISFDLWATGQYQDLGEALRHGAFNTVSIMTTTGFATADFDLWPDFTRVFLVGLMLIGGCAGSTAGGSKVIRLYVMLKHAVIQLRRLVRPNLVQTLHFGDREVTRGATEGVLGFYVLLFLATMVLGLAMTALGMDLVSGTTAAVSATNSVGPGLGTIGAAQNFAGVPSAGLYLLSGGMLLGRLEIYPVLVLFTSHFWRRG
jgi:trk system potassium uptake protein